MQTGNFYGNGQWYPQQGYYTAPMADQLTQLRQAQQPQQAQTSPIIWVQGEEGAKAYMVAPGNSVLLLDSEGSSFYIKSTDASGMPLPLRIFDYTERHAAQKPAQSASVEYVTRDEFLALKEEIRAMKKEDTDHEQSTV